MSLPSYQTAMLGYTIEGLTTTEAKQKRLPKWNWKVGVLLIRQYLDPKDLLKCSLVSKDFHDIFTSILWRDPISILKGKKNPFFELYRFMNSAHKMPIGLRSLVRMLDFQQIVKFRGGSQAQSSREKQVFDAMYNAAWFLYCTKLFPLATFVIMDSLPGLRYSPLDLADANDPAGLFPIQFSMPGAPTSNALIVTSSNAHDSILNKSIINAPISGTDDPLSADIRSVIQDAPKSQGERLTQVKLKPVMFSANGPGRCVLLDELITSNLVYLDLSYTTGDSDKRLHSVATFVNVRILKLRGCRMSDSELKKWLPIDRTLWCLDVRDNFLTDAAVFHILYNLMLERIQPPKQDADESSDEHLYEDTPRYVREDNGERLSTIVPTRPYERQEFINYVEKHVNYFSAHDLILDSNDSLLCHTGLTHLLISNNKLSSHGVKLLLTRTNRFQHLDVGSVQASNSSEFYVPYTTVYAQLDSRCAEGLSRKAGNSLEVLRIHHSIITYVPNIINVGSRNDGFTLPLVKQAETLSSMQRTDMMGKNPSHEAFSPLQNFRVRELVLTGVPTKSYGYIIDRLTDLLHDCDMQQWDLDLAREQMPPNRRSPKLLSGLRKICLEFIPEDTSALSPSGASVSGDRDADNFLASSEGDFSFFPQDTMSSASRRSSVATIGGTVAGPSTPASWKGSILGSAALQRQLSGLSSRSGSSSTPIDPPLYEESVQDVAQALKKWRADNRNRKWTGTLRLVYP